MRYHKRRRNTTENFVRWWRRELRLFTAWEDHWAPARMLTDFKLAHWSDICEVKAQNAQIFEGRPIAWWKARRAEHRALWNWVSKDMNRSKFRWPGWTDNDGNISDEEGCRCVACGIDEHFKGYDCGKCPIIWDGAGHRCMHDCSSYCNWDSLRDEGLYEEAHPYAAKVRDPPWKFEKEIVQ